MTQKTRPLVSAGNTAGILPTKPRLKNIVKIESDILKGEYNADGTSYCTEYLEKWLKEYGKPNLPIVL